MLSSTKNKNQEEDLRREFNRYLELKESENKKDLAKILLKIRNLKYSLLMRTTPNHKSILQNRIFQTQIVSRKL